jgi:beta-glucanase (GH16 family)
VLGATVASAQADPASQRVHNMGPNQVSASVSKRVKASGRYVIVVSLRAHRDSEAVSVYLTGAAKRAVRASSQAATTLHYALTVDAPSMLTAFAISARPAVQLAMSVERQAAGKHAAPSPPAPAPSATAPTSPAPSPGNQYPDPYTNLVWSDNFSAGVPSSSWNIVQCGSSCGGGVNSYTNSPSNVAVNGSGQLVITALKSGSSFSSAEVESSSISDSPYGAIEANIKLPSGQGLWPAFWFEGPNWPSGGEIDVLEAPEFGPDPNYAIFTLHGPWTTTDPSDNYQSFETDTTALGDLSTAFHTYGVVWSPNSIVWTIDGVAYALADPNNLAPNAEWAFNSISSYQIVLDMVVGGWPCSSSSPVAPPNPCPGASFPAQMVVNWVHVYH